MSRDKATITQFNMIARHFLRKLLTYLGRITVREREYAFIFESLQKISLNFAGRILRIMDIGSSSSLLPWRLAVRGYDVTAVDVRPYPFKHRRLQFLQMDVISPDFGRNLSLFDVVTCVSTIEHIGIGHYDDPMTREGDKLSLGSINRVLKPGGAILVTVPFAGQYSQDDFQRIYDPNSIARLFSIGWRLREERYHIPKGKKHWLIAPREEALRPHEAWSESNNACFWFEKVWP